MSVPESIASRIINKTGQTDNVGLSGSSVTVYDDCVLKIEPLRPETLVGIKAMQWLQDRAPVPKILCHEVANGSSILLMSRMSGKMACDPEYLEQPALLVDALAESLRFLWSVDTMGCPRERTLDALLEEARYNVTHGLVDLDLVEPETFSETGFRDPAHLLDWLLENKVASEPVLAHGDHCLPNVFLEKGHFRGYIDIGDMGIGEKWRDIALCWRSLRDNLRGKYGGKAYNFDPDRLFDALGITPDWEKMRYHLLLDELF
jgi:kanamycin kinase/aminoglycoside 3'-phosphotransferase-3